MPGVMIGKFHTQLQKMRRFQEKPMLGCMCPNEACTKTPIHSHLLSESWLSRLALDGHVLQIEIAVEDAGKRPVGFKPQRVGIGEATTFLGFCQRHDAALFSCLETEPFNANSCQIASLTYRSICREICVKHQMLKCHLADALSPGSPDFLAEKAAGELRHYLELLKRKIRVEEMLSKGNCDLASCVIQFETTPTFMVATTFCPYLTFTGRELERRMDWVTLTIVPGSKGGFAVFSWDKASPKNGFLLLKSLRTIPSHLVTDCILYLALEVTEYFVMSPRWWDSLSNQDRDEILMRFGRNLIMDVPPPPDLIVPPTSPVVDWKPVSITCI